MSESNSEWLLRIRGLRIGDEVIKLPGSRCETESTWTVAGLNRSMCCGNDAVELVSTATGGVCLLTAIEKNFVNPEIAATYQKLLPPPDDSQDHGQLPEDVVQQLRSMFRDQVVPVRADTCLESITDLEKKTLWIFKGGERALSLAAEHWAGSRSLAVQFASHDLTDQIVADALSGWECRSVYVNSHGVRGDFLKDINSASIERLVISSRRCDVRTLKLEQLPNVSKIGLRYGYGAGSSRLMFLPPKVTQLGLSYRSDTCSPSEVFDLGGRRLDSISLDGANPYLDDSAICDLAERCCVRNLSVDFSKLSDSGLRMLTEVESLRQVSLFGTAVTSKAVLGARRRRSDCNWIYDVTVGCGSV